LQLEGNALRTIRRPLITGPVSGLLRFLASRIPEDEGAVPASTPAQVISSCRRVAHRLSTGHCRHKDQNTALLPILLL